jgi:hypothetical protein
MLFGWASFAVAQGAPDAKTTQDLKKEDPLPPATGRNLSEQAGTTEPGSKVETSKDENVFVNGVLSVQGALADVDTAPSKFSERTAADDRLPIVGYRLRHLSVDQRREIARGLTVPRPNALSPSELGGFATIGRELPGPVAMQALTPVPSALAQKYPELKGAGYMSSDNKTIIVDLDNNLVIGVLGS